MYAPTVSTHRPLPEVPRRQRRLAFALVVIALVTAVAAAMAGWSAGARLASEPAPPPLVDGQAGFASVRVSSSWRPLEGSAGIAGLDAGRTAVFATGGHPRARAIVTVAPLSAASLIPDALRAVVERQPQAAEPATLLGLSAWRYAELPLDGGERAELTVVPTTRGVLAVACVAPEAAWAAAALGCASGLRALSIDGAIPLQPHAQLAAAAQLGPVLERLNRARVGGRRALASATTRAGQRRAATRLAAAYRGAAATLRPSGATAGSSAELVAGLESAERAYGDLARAAARGRTARYAAARHRVAAAEQLVSRHAAELAGATRVR